MDPPLQGQDRGGHSEPGGNEIPRYRYDNQTKTAARDDSQSSSGGAEERKRIGRENFPMTTVPITHLAAYEPALHHISEDHEEAMQEEINLAARRVSLAPVNRANIQSRSLSWRSGSLFWGRPTMEGDEDRLEHAHHMQLAQTFFPSCICATVLPIIHMLDDGDVSGDGIAVSEVAGKIIWNCLVEDPILFLRHFLEKLTNKDRQEEMMFLLRKLILFYKQLPAQMAHSLFNYLIGYVMFYVRSPCAGGHESIAGALSLLWQVIPSVEIYFKDLKQTLKKEQCDPNILISANVPSAKKIIVHGPDLSSIPSQFPIHEDTQFSLILQDSLDFFNIPDEQHLSHFLVDTKTNQMHNMNSYVRDFFFFRRNFYPQLSLVKMNLDDAFESLQKQAFTLKFVEIGKVLFSTTLLCSTSPHQLQNHVSFLHEEFIKLPSFPRKALEAEFGLYHGKWGKEIYGLDTLHKYNWVKLMYSMFKSMTKTFAWSSDLLLFLNVINGCIILHCEDTAMLRYCLAILINICRHFKHIFSMNGFMHVMPTILRVYSNNQSNPVICSAIQFACRQFYILHRKPFILQLFGSVAPILDMTDAESGLIDCRKVLPDNLFSLLVSIEKDCSDRLRIIDLIEGRGALRALDFCYENDPESFTMMDIINMCVTVVAYAPESFRSVQMLNILEVMVPRYLQYLRKETTRKDTPAAARTEVTAINNVGVALRSLVSAAEYFTRTMSVPVIKLENVSTNIKPGSHSSQGAGIYMDEDSHASRHMEEGRKKHNAQELEDMENRNEFRKPRDSLLCVIADFYGSCTTRLRELRRILSDPSFRPPELIDHKTHNRLAEIAHTLLKLAPYDPITMGCSGLQRYMVDILPITDWSAEAVRPALNLILRRLDRLFSKVAKKTALRCQMDWDAAANLLKGVFMALKKFPYIAHLPHLKTLVSSLLSIILSGNGWTPTLPESLPNMHSSHRGDHGAMLLAMIAPPTFCSAVVKLIAMQMQALGDQFSLEQMCGVGSFPSSDKQLNMMISLILPLLIRVGCGRRDSPKLRQCDIQFSLEIILSILVPPVKVPSQQNASKHHLSISEHGRCSSISHADKYSNKNENELLLQTAYLGLEILMVCFDKALSQEWHKVANSIHRLVSLPLWRFLDFVVTHRPSIFLLLQPFIQFRMMFVNCDTAQEYYLQQTVKDKLQGYSFIHPKSSGSILLQLALELRQLKDEFISSGGEYRSRSATFATDRSDFSQTHVPDPRLASMTDINPETIDTTKPTFVNVGKRASAATLSSTTSAAFRSTVVTSSFDSGSPDMSGQKTSRRISAKEGSKILEKFKKPSIQEDVSPSELPILSDGESRVQRQPTVVFRTVTKQPTTEEHYPVGILYENEEGETANGGARIRSMRPTTLEEVDSSDMDPKSHRLQRADAKSRKTFKIKRQKTKTTSMRMRFMSSRRGHPDRGHEDDNILDTAGITAQEYEILQLHRPLSATPAPSSPLAHSVETIPEAVEMKPAAAPVASRPRYVQRSKSHDDPNADFNAPAGTVRGRIARQGARIVRSRSPSSSPVRSPVRAGSSPAASPTHSQAYVVRCDSSESLNVNESSALLREDESDSQNSLCIFFDEGGKMRDTIV
ncbi:hypothetical protein ScPMuIL_010450 [Solemya velum]